MTLRYHGHKAAFAEEARGHFESSLLARYKELLPPPWNNDGDAKAPGYLSCQVES
jgi:hypothetical protein